MTTISANSAAQNAQAMGLFDRLQRNGKSTEVNPTTTNRVSQDSMTFSAQALNMLQQGKGAGDGDGDGDGK